MDDAMAVIRDLTYMDGEKTRPVFRLVIPNAEQALEDAVGDRVRAAQALLDDEEGDWEILRAAS